jgi:hypothetical protein
MTKHTVIPAQAGIQHAGIARSVERQHWVTILNPRFRGNSDLC